MKVAFVHDWLVTYRGGEKVLETMHELFPSAPIYTLFLDRQSLPKSFLKKDIRCLNWTNRFRALRKPLLPLLPSLIENLDLNEYDLIISSSSCVAKGVIPGVQAKHLCYIHSPMRYIWDQKTSYLNNMKANFLVRQFFMLFANYLRAWDICSNHRVDQFVANSSYVQNRIRRFYGRESQVIHPPVEMPLFNSDLPKEDYYLAAGALVPYKRFDLAIEACESLNKKLVIAGSGPELPRLKQLAKGNTVFVEQPNDEHFLRLLAQAKGLIFPGLEDYGMVAVEAIRLGTPLVAYGIGGVSDYLYEDINGVTFKEPHKEGLKEALSRFEGMQFSSGAVKDSLKPWRKQEFLGAMESAISVL